MKKIIVLFTILFVAFHAFAQENVVRVERRLLQPPVGKSLLCLTARVTPLAERLRNLKARGLHLAAGDLHELARAAHPARAVVVAEADQRVELSLRGRDAIASEEVVELGLVGRDLAAKKRLRLLLGDAVGVIVGAALRAVADVPLAVRAVLLRAEALFLFKLAESRAARAHRRTARQRRDTQLHRKAQREQQRKRRFLPCDVSHSLLSFSAREHKRSSASEFCPQYTIGLHKNQPEFDRFYANIPRSANFGKARDILTSARQRVRSGCRRSIRPPRCRGGRAQSDPPR